MRLFRKKLGVVLIIFENLLGRNGLKTNSGKKVEKANVDIGFLMTPWISLHYHEVLRIFCRSLIKVQRSPRKSLISLPNEQADLRLRSRVKVVET